MFVSMMLPVAFLVMVLSIGVLAMRNAEINPATIERLRRKNPVSPFERYEPAPMTDSKGNRTWESAVESRAQQLVRRSMNGFH